MKLRLSSLAAADADRAVAYYRSAAGTALSLRFVDALENALAHLARHPESGSPRIALETGLAGLRAWPLRGFPYQVFYAVSGDTCHVWRILGSATDIPARLRAPGTSDS